MTKNIQKAAGRICTQTRDRSCTIVHTARKTSRQTNGKRGQAKRVRQAHRHRKTTEI
jgi:hypothetical protein